MTIASIKPIAARHALAAARLHRNGIGTGFLSSLGLGFLKQIYAALPRCPAGFGYVWEEPDGAILGFIACAESTALLYKQSLLRRGPRMALPLARSLLRPGMILRMFQTLRYPSQAGEGLPAAEVLSISVSGQSQGRGVGKALMNAAFEEFRRRGVRQVKVAVGTANKQANAFYRRCGYTMAVTREHHGLPMNIYVIDLPSVHVPASLGPRRLS